MRWAKGLFALAPIGATACVNNREKCANPSYRYPALCHPECPLIRKETGNFSMDDREQELKEVPHRLADKSRWPKGIRSISIDEADALGTDAKGELYWHGKPVEIRRPLDLTWRQKLVAGIIATATVIAAVGAAAQGWAAYNDWACEVGWKSIACPLPSQTNR